MTPLALPLPPAAPAPQPGDPCGYADQGGCPGTWDGTNPHAAARCAECRRLDTLAVEALARLLRDGAGKEDAA